MSLKNKAVSLVLTVMIIFSVTSCGKTEEQSETTAVPETYYNESTYYDNTVTSDVTLSEEVAASQNESITVSASNTSPALTQEQNTAETPQNTVSAEAEKPTIPSTTEFSAIESGVGTYNATYNNVEQLVIIPYDAIKASKKVPVLVWANGTAVSYDIYLNLLNIIAAEGYIVVANGERMSADGTSQRASIDFIISENSNKNSPLYKKVDTEKIGAMGHSQGGRSAVNAAAADSRIKAVMSLAGSNYKEEAEKLSTPVFFITGTSDKIVDSATWVKTAYDVSKGPKVYASLKGGLHTTCTSNPEKYGSYITDWFDIWLKGKTSNKEIFKDGGTLSKDSAWVDFASQDI